MTHLLTEAVIYGNASVCQTGERKGGDEGVSTVQSVHKERGRKRPSQWPLPISFQCNQIRRSVVGPIFDSSLSKQAILKAIGCVNTPFLHSRSWVDFAIWFGHGTRQIQPCQSSAEASSLGTEWTNTVEWTVGLCSSVILWLTLRKICQLIPHLHCRWTHTESKTHQRWNTNLQCSGNVRESGTDLYSGRSWLWNDGKLELDVAWKEFTRRCVCGGMSCQE